MKTSKDWLESIIEAKRPVILDPDGWDRSNYDYSFNEELITKEEFYVRVIHSTVKFNTFNALDFMDDLN